MIMRAYLLIVAFAVCCAYATKQVPQEIAKAINNDPTSTWKANEHMSQEEFDSYVSRLMHGPERMYGYENKASKYVSDKTAPSTYSSLPATFDGRTVWPTCIHPVLDQGDCGSCWAFGSSESLSDRFCIHSGGDVNVVLSPQNLLSCEHLNLGCTLGSLPGWAWSFLEKTGITTIECVPYVNGNGGKVPECQTACANSSVPFVKYHAANYTHLGSLLDPDAHLNDIMSALTEGPVDALFNVYSDFVSYTSGVYQHKTGSYEGLHNVKVYGYGVENGTAFWYVQNSWGTAWGDDGYFKMIRGIDDCGFERDMYTGYPLLN